MKRLAKFIRSVMPADPYQLLFLAGVVCLVAAHGLRWWPAGLAHSWEILPDWELVQALRIFCVYFVIFSAMAGYYVCFWPGMHPIRRVVWLICVPCLFGLGLMFGCILYVNATPSSVLESTGSMFGHNLRWTEATFWKLPAGFHFTLLGLLLIAAFASRMAFGISTLPLALHGENISQSKDSESWRRLQFLIFVLVGPFFLLLSFINIGVFVFLLSRSPAYLQSVWFGRLAPVFESLVAYGLLLCFVGRGEKQTLRQALRWPGGKNLLLAGAFAIGIDVMIAMGQYVADLAQWAAHNFGWFDPPRLGAYFSLPDPWLFLLLLAALCEEIVFRGLLQVRLIQRYGLYRGIFLVGIVWAAYHFYWDFSFVRPTQAEVLEKLVFRIFMCVVLSFVFGWLTLRAGSVLPAAVAHGVYNVLTTSSLGPPFPMETFVQIGLWAVLAYALFRYWPIRVEGTPETAEKRPDLETAN